MRLDEITKRQFVNKLKHPQNARIREMISELRKMIGPLGWKIRIRYDEHGKRFLLTIQNEDFHSPEEAKSKTMRIIIDLFRTEKFKHAFLPSARDDIILLHITEEEHTRMNEITEGLGKEFDVHDFLRKEAAYVIYLGKVVPVVVRGKTTFQELDYEVTLLATDAADFGGLLHVAQEDIFRTEEEAEKELFKRELKGKKNTAHLRTSRW